MSLRLIHFPQTRSLRVVWALYELGVEAEIETRVFDRPSLKSSDYLALNPLGKTPVFFDGQHRLIESTAIIEYIANKFANANLTRQPHDADYGAYLQWLHFGEAGMGGYVNMLIGHTALLPEDQRIGSMAAWAKAETVNCLNFIEESLDEKDYLLGKFSLADISLVYLLFLIKITRNGAIIGEKTNAYFKRATGRDAWKRACALAP